MSLPVKALNRVKFRPSLDMNGKPQPTQVTVFVRLSDQFHAKNPSLYEILYDEDKWFKREFERETPQFFYHFVVGAKCDEGVSSDWVNRSVVIISDDPKTWMELYEKAKTREPRRIGGALVLGEGWKLDDEMRNVLKEKTGGHLPLFVSEGDPWTMVFKTLRKAESILIWQRLSLATRRKQNKSDYKRRRLVRCERKDTTVWIRVGSREKPDIAFLNSQNDLFVPHGVKYFGGERLPRRRDLLYREGILLISTCPKKLVEMYDRIKKEWEPTEIDLALIKCDLSKAEKKELECHLGDHLPSYYRPFVNPDEAESYDLYDVDVDDDDEESDEEYHRDTSAVKSYSDPFAFREEIHFAVEELSRRVRYQQMTKAWNLAKLEKKRAERRSREADEEEDSDADSRFSWDSVDELPSDYEDNEGKESIDDEEDSDDGKHDCTKCANPTKPIHFIKELMDRAADHYESSVDQKAIRVKIDNWLYKLFDAKYKALFAECMKEKGELPSDQMSDGIKRRSWEHTKAVFKEVLNTDRDNSGMESLMDGLRKKISKIESSSGPSQLKPSENDVSEGLVEQKTLGAEVAPESEKTAKKRKFRPDPIYRTKPSHVIFWFNTGVELEDQMNFNRYYPDSYGYSPEDVFECFKGSTPGKTFAFYFAPEFPKHALELDDVYNNVILVATKPETWLEMYEKTKEWDCPRIGGALVLKGRALSDESRNVLETRTGGHLPLIPTDWELYDLIDELIPQLDSLLIQQKVSLAARKRENKRALRRQRKDERPERRTAAWIRVGWQEQLDLEELKTATELSTSSVRFFDDDELPMKKDLHDLDAILLVSTCPKKLLAMYNRAKEEWDEKEIDLALFGPKLPWKEMEELEFRLDGHQPRYGSEGRSLDEEIREAVDFFKKSDYHHMTKVWHRSRVLEKRFRAHYEEANDGGESDDSGSAVSFDSVDELSSNFEVEFWGLGDWERGYQITEEHDCTNCVSPAEANDMLKEAFSSISCSNRKFSAMAMEAIIAGTDNWLYKVFDNKQKALVAEYMKENDELMTEEALKGIQMKASVHAEVVLRKVKRWSEGYKIRARMERLQRKMSKMESSLNSEDNFSGSEEDSDEEDGNRKSFSGAEADSVVVEVFNDLFGASKENLSVMRARIASTDDWLLKAFKVGQKIFTEKHVRMYSESADHEVAQKHIRKEASAFTEEVLRRVMRWDDDKKIKAAMDGFLKYISIVLPLKVYQKTTDHSGVDPRSGIRRPAQDSDVTSNDSDSDISSDDSDSDVTSDDLDCDSDGDSDLDSVSDGDSDPNPDHSDDSY